MAVNHGEALTGWFLPLLWLLFVPGRGCCLGCRELVRALCALINTREAGRECAMVQVQSRGGKSIKCIESLHTENGFPPPGALSIQDFSALSLELMHRGQQRIFGSEGFTDL